MGEGGHTQRNCVQAPPSFALRPSKLQLSALLDIDIFEPFFSPKMMTSFLQGGSNQCQTPGKMGSDQAEILQAQNNWDVVFKE